MRDEAVVEPLGPALVQWNDYVGTAAADDIGVAAASRSLYELTGLDPSRWLILAVDLSVSAGAEQLIVYAFDRDRHEVGSHADLLSYAHESGTLPVTAVELTGSVSLQEALQTAFRQIAVRLTARGVSDQRLTVTDHVRATSLKS